MGRSRPRKYRVPAWMRNGIFVVECCLGLGGWIKSDARSVHDHNWPAIRVKSGKITGRNKAARAAGI